MPCPDDNELVAYAEGRLRLGRTAELELHLDVCPTCAGCVADAARLHTADRPITRVLGASDELEPPAPLPGDRIGRYRVGTILGRGGMGTVVQAHDSELDRDVALKLLRRSAAELPDGPTRLFREARSMAQLAHPNVVAVFEVGVADARVFVAMELVDGQDLRTWLRSHRSTRQIVEVFTQAGRGLLAAHEAGVLHRDFKPDNVLVGRDHDGPHDRLRVRVADFGLAQSLDGAPSDPGASYSASSGSHSSARLTHAGQVLGTPAYMAPEQHGDETIDARADQYAFCAALYEALWGRLPFVGRTVDELAAAKLRGAPQPPAQPRVPTSIRRAVLRGLAVRPAARHRDMAALLHQLGRASRPRARLALAATATFAVVLVGAASSGGDPRCADAETRLAGVWSDDERAALEGAFVDPARPHTRESATRVLDAVDRWGASWTHAHALACTAARDGDATAIAELDGRMRCLDRDRTELAALLDVFAVPDDTVVVGSIRAVAQLPDPSQCLDTDVPRGAGRGAADERFAHIHALASAGRYADAWVEAERLPDDPEVAADPIAHTRALLLLGRMRQRTSAFEPAEAVLTEAYFAAQDQGDPELLADTALGVLSVICEVHNDPRDAEPWARHAAAAITAAGDDPRARAALHKALGTIAMRSGDYARARSEAEQGLAISVAAFGDDGLEVADFSNNLANVAFFEGRHEDAIELNLRALEIRRDRLGAHHPNVGDSYNNLGAANHDLGHYQEAALDHQQSLAISQAAFGRVSQDVAASHNNLGGVYHRLGDPEQAIAHYREALEIWSQVHDPDHPDVAYAHHNLGNVLHDQGRDDEAAAAYQRALEIRERALGPDHPHVAYTLTNLGVVDEAAGRLPRARDEFERAIAMLEPVLGTDHADIATVRDNLGLVLRRQGELDASVAMHRSALRVHLDKLGPEHPQTATTEYGLGRALRAKGDREALEHLRRACAATPAAELELVEERRGVLAAAEAELGTHAHATVLAAVDPR